MNVTKQNASVMSMPTSRETRHRKVEEAIVRISRLGGRGVLLGEVIVTAAHCISFELEGGMVLGDYYIEEIETRHGERLKVAPLAVEPVADIALLGCLDPQAFDDEARQFEAYCERTRPVPLARGPMPQGKEFVVWVLNANGKWAEAQATVINDVSPHIWIESHDQIKGGASGGPILNQRGELVAIVSHTSVPATGGSSSGSNPRPLRALPVWACERYLSLPRAC